MSFFFSSRRRHTRLTCDWSSDVCSSDLRPARVSGVALIAVGADDALDARLQIPARDVLGARDVPGVPLVALAHVKQHDRSEERRVGKECRYRWARCDEREKGGAGGGGGA